MYRSLTTSKRKSCATISWSGFLRLWRQLARENCLPCLPQREIPREGLHHQCASGGTFLCDGVGLGKTYVGMMLIERLVIHDRKRVALFVPKAARYDVWERDLRHYLRYLGGDFSNLVIFNHTDLLRGGEFQYRLDRVKEMAEAIIIDEAHQLRLPL